MKGDFDGSRGRLLHGRSLATTDVSLRSSAGAGEAAALPPGWEAHEDEQGAIYFYNVHTEEVQWEAASVRALRCRSIFE